VFADFDSDGDVDVMTYPLQLTPVYWRNDVAASPGFEIRLDDERTANRYAIGARVEIRAPDGRRQMREIKASGGNQSHDVLVARFGLGDWPSVASVHIRWPDGETDDIGSLSLKPGRYRIVRLPRGQQPMAVKPQ
jgi:hypothetical protein